MRPDSGCLDLGSKLLVQGDKGFWKATPRAIFFVICCSVGKPLGVFRGRRAQGRQVAHKSTRAAGPTVHKAAQRLELEAFRRHGPRVQDRLPGDVEEFVRLLSALR